MVIVAYSLGLIHIGTQDGDRSKVTISVDKEKVKEDVDKVKEGIKKTEGKVMEAITPTKK